VFSSATTKQQNNFFIRLFVQDKESQFRTHDQ